MSAIDGSSPESSSNLVGMKSVLAGLGTKYIFIFFVESCDILRSILKTKLPSDRQYKCTIIPMQEQLVLL